ncbi:hypothetical protein [Mycobacterium sp. ITM-2016-00318]|uniref:hypothetical protein n=1 Tax=Mycobacterium sp. ITM-2016-00318 TaxID=2099693 RepID=UPI0013049EA9|nr:hypothetical protein [Mycobacterium sp. ITM-2016-00318]WNG91095.1 hypothetical protein C6A82_016380 [Mycobacterium sp. ITM-2016-00318]
MAVWPYFSLDSRTNCVTFAVCTSTSTSTGSPSGLVALGGEPGLVVVHVGDPHHGLVTFISPATVLH